jgi:hypothetical protein
LRAGLALVLALAVLSAPARADTWLAGDMQDAGPHPRSLLDPDLLPVLQERVQREPYKTLLARIDSVARQQQPLDVHDISTERARAATARAAAWLFVLDREVGGDGEVGPFDADERRAMGDKAAELLLTMKTESRSGGLATGILDIHSAQELHLWADTLDLLLGADVDALEGDRAAAVQGVADLAADLYSDFHGDNWYATRPLVNNHRSKSASAIGIAALVLNGESWLTPDDVEDERYEAARWIDFGLRGVDLVQRDLLSDEDGGNMEGGGYLDYAGIEHFPFLWAWSRITERASWTLPPPGLGPPWLITGQTEPYDLPDLWTSPWLARQLRWAVSTLEPDGEAPPFDDSTPGSRLFWGAFANSDFEDAPAFRHAWERLGMPSWGSVNSSAFLVAAFDDSVAAASPEELGWAPSSVHPRAGQVLLRSGWDDDATWLLLLAEHGKAMGWSQSRWGEYIDGAAGHEHPDGLSFMLSAYGEDLLIDSGYLGWEQHELVNNADNHSLVLVNGAGPAGPRMVVPLVQEGAAGELVPIDPQVEGGWSVDPGDDGLPDGSTWLLQGHIDVPGVSLARAVTRFSVDAPLTEHQREVVFLADRFFVLRDELQTQSDVPVEYTHSLHSHCGGDSDGDLELLDDGARCTRGDASLRLAVVDPPLGTPSTREAVHDERFWQQRTHAAVEWGIPSSPLDDSLVGASFTTLLVPEATTAPVLWQDAEATGRRWGDDELECVVSWGGDALTAPDGTPLLAPEGQAAWCGSSGSLAGHARSTTEQLFSFTFDDAGAVDSWQVRRLGADSDPLGLPAVPGQQPDGACGWTEANGQWLVDSPVPGRLATAYQARPVVASLALPARPSPEPAWFPTWATVELSAASSCARSGEELDFTWTLVQRPELSQAVLPAGDDGNLLVVDFPGLYRVRILVRGASGEDEAELDFEVVGEPVSLPDPTEDPPASEPPVEGCGCDEQSGQVALLLVLSPLGMRRRRA